MKGKGKKPSSPVANLRKIGIVERKLDAAQSAGRHWRGAHHVLPWLDKWIKLNCLIALLGALSCLVIVFSRPRPTLLVSFPDGTTVCSLPPLDPQTRQPLPRPDDEEALCRSLAIKSGRGDDEATVGFSHQAQSEPEAASMPAPAQVQAPVSTGNPSLNTTPFPTATPTSGNPPLPLPSPQAPIQAAPVESLPPAAANEQPSQQVP